MFIFGVKIMINKVFVTHNVSEKNMHIVDKFIEVLKKDNIIPVVPKLDPKDPRPTISVHDSVQDDLNSSDFVLVIWTKDNVGSQYVNIVLEDAMAINKKIIAITEEGAILTPHIQKAAKMEKPIMLNINNIMAAVTAFASHLPCPNI